MAQPRMLVDDTSVSHASDYLDKIQYVVNSELKNLNRIKKPKHSQNRVYDTRIKTKNKATQNNIIIKIRDREITLLQLENLSICR